MDQTFELPWPPTLNNYWRIWRGRMLLSKTGRKFKKTPPPPFIPYKSNTRLKVVIELYPPTRARRDLDNHAKAANDLLEHWGVFPNDEQIDDLRLIRRTVSNPGKAIVHISEMV